MVINMGDTIEIRCVTLDPSEDPSDRATRVETWVDDHGNLRIGLLKGEKLVSQAVIDRTEAAQFFLKRRWLKPHEGVLDAQTALPPVFSIALHKDLLYSGVMEDQPERVSYTSRDGRFSFTECSDGRMEIEDLQSDGQLPAKCDVAEGIALRAIRSLIRDLSGDKATKSASTQLDTANSLADRLNNNSPEAPDGWSAKVWSRGKGAARIARVYVRKNSRAALDCGFFAVQHDGEIVPYLKRLRGMLEMAAGLGED